MADKIKVDTNAYMLEALRLGGAIDSFREYTTAFAKQADDMVSGFNSDFIDRLKFVLEHIGHDAGPEMLAKVEEHSRKVAALAEAFASADDALADSLKGGD